MSASSSCFALPERSPPRVRRELEIRAGADKIDGPVQRLPVPKDDPELRALIDEQYQDYITGTESYLNCLNDEAVRARAAYYEVFERYIRYFGVEAGVEFDAAD